MAVATAALETIFDHPDKVQDRSITADGYKTHYLEAGDPSAEPLVLVHGGSMEIGLGVDRWYPNILPLAKTFHVFAADEIGHGYTDAPRNPDHLGHVRYRAEHVIAFIEALGVGPVHLVGQSQGGWIVTYITLTRPDLVRDLVMIDSGSTSGSDAGQNSLPYYNIPGLYRESTRVPAMDMRTRDGIRSHFSIFVQNKAMVTDQLVDRLLPLAERWNDRYMAHVQQEWTPDSPLAAEKTRMYEVDGQHISHSVHRIDRPTLLIWGKQSVKGLDPGVDLYKKIPGAQLHIFDQANHFLWLDQPRDFNSLVTWFLTKD